MTAMSESLLARDVYCVCFTQRDGIDSLHGELAQARKQYFTSGKKPVKVGKNQIVKGFDGKLSGKLSRHGFYWKKTAGQTGEKIALEEAFDQKHGQVLVRRDLQNIIVSRAFFDKDRRWVRSEYYEPWDPVNARVSLKPSDASAVIERFDRGAQTRSVELYPLPYLGGTAEQSILNARFGEPQLIVSTAEGEFCYCPKQEMEARKRALEEIKNGTVVLMPAWEVKDGSLTGDEGEEETSVTFTSLEEYATVRPGAETSGEHSQSQEPEPPSGALDLPEGEEFTPAAEETSPEETVAPPEIAEPDMEALPQPPDIPGLTQQEEPQKAPSQALDAIGCQRAVREGQLTGRGRTEQQNGLTAYDGEYRDGKREGFGSYYYKDGNLCYAGSWKDDKRDGLGVSFRDADHALHVAKWENGQPAGFVSLFDKDGNLRYGGRIENGKKQGAGVSFNQADGTIFVGAWEDGKPTGLGSAFDKDGRLLYYGGWKDGKRNGRGTEFDSSGGIVFDGEWKDGKYHNGILYQKLPQQGAADDSGPNWDL